MGSAGMCGIYSILDLADAARCVVYNIHEHADAAMCVIYNIIERADAAVCVIYSIIAKHAGTAEIWILEGASFRCHLSSSLRRGRPPFGPRQGGTVFRRNVRPSGALSVKKNRVKITHRWSYSFDHSLKMLK